MLGNGRFFRKEVHWISKVFSPRSAVRHKTDTAKQEIVIPKRIEREPTDILKALSSTVHSDPTSYHYKYMDDPYLLPSDIAESRIFALSKESGKKSARWVVKENPGFFKHVSSDPPIEAFISKSEDVLTKENFTEEALLRAIEERKVLDAIKIYEHLKTTGVSVEKSTQQSLLELACFYNNDDAPNFDLETKWFTGFLGRVKSEPTFKDWDPQGFAKRLFDEMDPKCPLANSAIIAGMARHKSYIPAFDMYKKAKAEGIRLSVDVYNSILFGYTRTESASMGNRPSRNFVLILKIVMTAQDGEVMTIVSKLGLLFFLMFFKKDVLSDMSELHVEPNVGTLCGALKGLGHSAKFDLARKIVNEFSVLGINPSLGCYLSLFRILSGVLDKTDWRASMMNELMEHIENSEHEILDRYDLVFFRELMIIFCELVKDVSLALRLWHMLERNNNRKFMVRASDEHMFFERLLLLVFDTKPLDFAMDVYRKVSFTYVYPQVKIVKKILKVVRENLSSDYLEEIWRDLHKLSLKKNRLILLNVLELSDDFTDEKSLNVFYEAGVACLGKADDFKEGDEVLYPYIMKVFLKKDDERKLCEVVSLFREKNLHFINMSEGFVEELFEYAMLKKNSEFIAGCLWIAEEQINSSTSEMAKRALPFLKGEHLIWAESLARGGNQDKTKSEFPGL